MGKQKVGTINSTCFLFVNHILIFCRKKRKDFLKAGSGGIGPEVWIYG